MQLRGRLRERVIAHQIDAHAVRQRRNLLRRRIRNHTRVERIELRLRVTSYSMQYQGELALTHVYQRSRPSGQILGLILHRVHKGIL